MTSVNLTFLFVAVLYFLSIFAWRRWAGEFPWKIAIFFYALTLLFLFRPLALSWVNAPSDYLYSLAPWSGYRTGAVTRSNPELNDVVLQITPWAHQVRESWRSLRVPLWNENAGSGYPLLANGQSAPFSIFRWLTLPLPLAESLGAEAALRILLALSFSYLFMRRAGYPEEGSVITAVTFGFSSFMTVWLQFPMASVAALLPATFYAVDLLVEQVSPRRVVFATGVMALLVLNGHPETAAHILFASGLYLSWLLARERSREALRGLMAIVAAGCLALLLALPFLLPFVEALPRSKRIEVLRAIPGEIARSGLPHLVPFFQAEFFGTEGGRNIWGPGKAEQISGWPGIFAFTAWFAALADLIRRRTLRDPIVFFIFATPLFLGIVLGWPVVSDLFHRLPLFSLAANGRLRLVFCWFIAILAGHVASRALLGRERWLLLVAAGSGALLLLVAFLTSSPPGPRHLEGALVSSILSALTLVVLALIGLWRRIPPSVACLMLLVVVGAELCRFGLGWNPVTPKWQFYPKTPLIRFLEQKKAELARRREPFRIAASGGVFFPNVASIFGLEDIRVHDPMSYARYLGALRVFGGYSSDKYFGVMFDFRHSFIDYLNVRYLISAAHEDYSSERFRLIYDGEDGRVYENRDVLPRFFAARNVVVEFDDRRRVEQIIANEDWKNRVVLKRLPTWLVEAIRQDVLVGPSPEQALARVGILHRGAGDYLLDIDAPRWTMIISSIPDFPGWQIDRNGGEEIKKIEVNEAFIGFLVPKGRSTVHLVYRPLSFVRGMWIAVLTALALVAWVAWDAVRRRGLRSAS